MNSQNIKVQQQKYGSLNDYSLKSLDASLGNFSSQRPWNTGRQCQTQLPALEGGPNKLNHGHGHGHANVTSIISSHFPSPTSAFYATESCMSFAQSAYSAKSLSPCSRLSNSDDSATPFDPTCISGLTDQSDLKLQSSNNLQSDGKYLSHINHGVSVFSNMLCFIEI